MSSETNDNFKRLSLGATIQKTFVLYGRGFKTLTLLYALTTVLIGLTWSILLVFLNPVFEIDAGKLTDPEYLLAHIKGFYAMLGIYMLVCLAIGSVMTGPVIRAIVDLYMGKKPNVKHCLKVGVMRAHTICCASVVGSFLVCIGMIFLLFPGMYLCLRWFFVSPIIVVEGLGVFGSLKRSWNLAAGSCCYVFCVFTILQTLMIVLNMVWQMLLGIEGSGALFSVYGALVSLVPCIILGPIFSIVITLMYLNMRIEKEGLNESELIRNMGESGALEGVYTSLATEEGVDESPLLDQELDVAV
ncbi:MAG: hypothetical protein SGBAC_013239 [Bacillariaceae sp.]